MRSLVFFGVLAMWLCLPATGWAQDIDVYNTRGYASLIGPYAQQPGVYGGDLGIPVVYNGQLRFLVGDAWSNTYAWPIFPNEWLADVQLNLDFSTYDLGYDILIYVYWHQESPLWRTDLPVTIQKYLGAPAVITVHNGGSSGQVLTMGAGRTPAAAFANHASSGGGVFAFFNRGMPRFCSSDSDCIFHRSDRNLRVCDNEMGVVEYFTDGVVTNFEDNGGYYRPCLMHAQGGSNSNCRQNPSKPGLCMDPTSSLYQDTESGRVYSVIYDQRVGEASSSNPTVYYSKIFDTNKFITVTARAVRNFDVMRPYNHPDNDFRTPDPNNPTGHEKVFLWGRPNFLGGMGGKSDKVYLAVVDMPTTTGNGTFTFEPKYFSNFAKNPCWWGGGRAKPDSTYKYPCWVPDDTLAKPLILGPNNSTNEEKDVVLQQSVTYLDLFDQFIMIYGGDVADDFIDLAVRQDAGDVDRNSHGRMYFRHASYPWGGWSAPEEIADTSVEWENNGMAHSPNCSGVCALAEGYYPAGNDEYGRMYGANIIAEWTYGGSGGTREVVFWTASTWNPYQTVLMATEFILR